MEELGGTEYLDTVLELCQGRVPNLELALEKKVLVCNLSGHKDLIFPSKGTCYLEKFDYETFEKKVLNLIEMPLSKYYEGMSESPKMVLNQNKDTADIIKNEILKNLN